VGGSTLVCLFRVTDDDGLVDVDTVRVTVSASVDADLSALVPSAGTLSPAFARATTAYSLSVANSVTSITLTPTAANAAATIRVNGVVVAGGSASGNLALAVGANILTVAVTAQSGLVKTYTVTATREGTTLPDLVITSATITAITATSVNYSYTIRNDGGTTIPDLWSVSIQNFYSNDQIFNNTGDAAAGGSILGARRSLAPGESYSGTYQASGAPDAFQYVTWKIDWGDAVAESNENNNTVAMPIR
ncbi:MAG TPA: cadherin-like beta sandwich domain-containing protein, partial [Fibrobacteria bacterium]|nr:cadherin-like beta sandwich domain-containing protein [Fibrobacteria bacterium]